MSADIKAQLEDRGECTSLMEPMKISETSCHRGVLSDLSVELAAKSSGFKHSLPNSVLKALADLVRAMNCYYSNLIEGHHTHPVDIERALKDNYSTNLKQRNLQLEAKAHMTVQRWIDEGGLNDQVVSLDGICEIHKRFTELLPTELLWVENPDTGERVQVIPGELREKDVSVGRHMPISPGAIKRFLKYFEKTYSHLGKAEIIISAAAAHH